MGGTNSDAATFNNSEEAEYGWDWIAVITVWMLGIITIPRSAASFTTSWCRC